MSTVNDEQFELKGPDAEATGILKGDGFLVRAGAIARKNTVPSVPYGAISIRNQLLSDGVLVEEGSGLRFTKDYLFRSPSGAAAAVLGRAANGWTEWTRTDGATLSEVKRVSRDKQTPLLDDAKREQILKKHRQLVNEGQLPTEQQLDKQYALFRERFGPSVLGGLDGEALLNLMHDHSNRDSLVYWLEFKNDEEFETRRFGSIAGGSALKLRIFRRKETGNWQAADKSNNTQDISLETAIEIARTHRDQLLKGAELLEKLSDNASDEDYAQLQDDMDDLAPEVSRRAWGHKYFSLLFPNKLDDYHSPKWQRFHLIKLLQLPPAGNGRYICAGRYVAAASEVGLPMSHFTAALSPAQGRLHRYWRIGTTAGFRRRTG
jgi:5-methylcytosine-specific restriction protein B